jgi:seryl-tRNA synthetase
LKTLDKITRERDTLRLALEHTAAQLESLNKITKERDALRAALDQASVYLRRSQGGQRYAAEMDTKQEEIATLRQRILATEAENRRLRTLVAQTCIGGQNIAKDAVPAIDPFAAAHSEEEYLN